MNAKEPFLPGFKGIGTPIRRKDSLHPSKPSPEKKEEKKKRSDNFDAEECFHDWLNVLFKITNQHFRAKR